VLCKFPPSRVWQARIAGQTLPTQSRQPHVFHDDITKFANQMQICTDILYQPLTLLDCLHTFCGADLKEWFAAQAAQAENGPSPPAPGATIFNCPSCRAPVRDTRHNATVATLLDMFLLANPDKQRTEAEKAEIQKKYKAGEDVLPKLRSKTREELRAEEEERRLIEQARIASLRDAGVEGESSRRRSRRPNESRSRESSSSRRTGRAPSNTREDGGGRSRDRRTGDHLTVEGGHGRSSSSGYRSDNSSDSRRQVGHQSSLRSLLEADMSHLDMEQEIEDLARQIQAEGLLEGRDLDSIDLSNDDELSRRITEIYQRRQRERSRHEPARRSNASGVSATSRSDVGATSRSDVGAMSRSDVGAPSSGHRDQREGRPRTLRRNSTGAHSAASSVSGRVSDDRRRPPQAPSAGSHVGMQVQRPRRPDSASRNRSSTSPAEPARTEAARIPPRAATDLSIQTREATATRSILNDTRSTSSPIISSTQRSPELASLPFASRVPQPKPQSHPNSTTQSPFTTPPQSSSSRFPENRRSLPPTDLAMVSSVMASFSSASATPQHKRSPSQLHAEPSVTCSRCNKEHIEYELHYNCKTCAAGNWNICLKCYRTGKGCQHWFGFGYAAWNKWEERRRQNPGLERPHMLTASRYQPPKPSPGGADGRRTLTMEDPAVRLESGTFCCNCLKNANECYWRCDVCNRGDWGFCNTCVNQGKCCSHPLLPLTYQPPSDRTPPRSPLSPRPHAAAVLTTPTGSGIGPFLPMTFNTRCDLCHNIIAPTEHRLHCFECASSLESDTLPGDYDICNSCYDNLVARRQISAENGPQGWRRCPAGHRMVVVAFQPGKGGQYRYIIQGLVGGRCLTQATVDSSGGGSGSSSSGEIMSWGWQEGSVKKARLVTRDVAAAAPTAAAGAVVPNEEELTLGFPLEELLGMTCVARWGWFGKDGVKAEDELNFPVGAEVREVIDINAEWYFGTYMGEEGLFPAGYVVVL
jgi:hypothetical protein